MAELLKINNLSMDYETSRSPVRAIRNVSLELDKGEILGLVGESGCGKSAMLLTILRLIPYPGKIKNGEIIFQGDNLLQKSTRAMRDLRGKNISMIFQDPMTTLNPVFKVGEQIRETLRIHGIVGSNSGVGFLDKARKNKEREIVLNLMREVGIPSEEDRYYEYPHEYSGGMQQRALVAAALACRPELLLADEPTTALDVTIQAQIMALLQRINRDRGTAIILVTHDLALAAEFCHRIAVMYAGEIVEIGVTEDIIRNPRHPYTIGLLNSIPKITEVPQRLIPIPGTVPDLANLSGGCAFYPRCEQGREECLLPVDLVDTSGWHNVRCILYGQGRQAGVIK